MASAPSVSPPSPTHFHAELNPQTEIQFGLVETMVMCRWRQKRLWVLENAKMQHEIRRQAIVNESESKRTRAALAFTALSDESRALDNLNRYETRIDRQFSRCLQRFNELRANQSVVEDETFEPEPNEFEEAPIKKSVFAKRPCAKMMKKKENSAAETRQDPTEPKLVTQEIVTPDSETEEPLASLETADLEAFDPKTADCITEDRSTAARAVTEVSVAVEASAAADKSPHQPEPKPQPEIASQGLTLQNSNEPDPTLTNDTPNSFRQTSPDTTDNSSNRDPNHRPRTPALVRLHE